MRQLPECYYRTPIGRNLLDWLYGNADEITQRNGCGEVIAIYTVRRPTMQVAPS